MERFNTRAVLDSGVLRLPTPKTDVPHDREEVQHYDSSDWTEVIESGKLLAFSGYYGKAYAWKAEPCHYRGILLQYRRVTEDQTFYSLRGLVAWFSSVAEEAEGEEEC